MKKKIKIKFTDFWGGFDCDPTRTTYGTPRKSIMENPKWLDPIEGHNNFFYEMLQERYDIEISESPDFLVFSVFGDQNQMYNCVKIFYTGENRRPDYNVCDYSISFDYSDDMRNFRFPLSAVILFEQKVRNTFPKEINLDMIKKEKINFCNFVFSNPNAQMRNTLFSELSKYKKVDAGGSVYNNMGKLVGDKQEFLNKYKFTICFENSEYDGYTTEKIVHPKLVNSIPIYWGNPSVSKDWNTKSFINAYDFNNISELIDYIKKIDNDDDMYYSMLSEPHFEDDVLPHDFQYEKLLDFFDKIYNIRDEKKM